MKMIFKKIEQTYQIDGRRNSGKKIEAKFPLCKKL